jgi:hypothetical protein
MDFSTALISAYRNGRLQDSQQLLAAPEYPATHAAEQFGIKRDALLTAQGSGGLGKCQCQAAATGLHCRRK